MTKMAEHARRGGGGDGAGHAQVRTILRDDWENCVSQLQGPGSKRPPRLAAHRSPLSPRYLLSFQMAFLFGILRNPSQMEQRMPNSPQDFRGETNLNRLIRGSVAHSRSVHRMPIEHCRLQA